tara:strand:- start:2891 stop:3538 length:648 start_codon:yes stop_codon:yes gene_type:complete
MKIGILIQGSITEWTPHIINEYKENFPEAEILLSTWNNENIGDINCDLIQLEKPEKTSPHESNINFQIKGAVEGLKEMKSDTILKTKTNQFIHNGKIFDIFKKDCKETQIMTTELNSWHDRDYRITDFCQLAKKQVLEEYWYNMPYYDGTYAIPPEVYLTKNYVVNSKKDTRPWSTIINEYFCLKDYFTDFDIEFEKFVYDETKQDWLKRTVNEL